CGTSPYWSRERVSGAWVVWPDITEAAPCVAADDIEGAEDAAEGEGGAARFVFKLKSSPEGAPGAPDVLPVSGAFCVTGFCSAASIDISAPNLSCYYCSPRATSKYLLD